MLAAIAKAAPPSAAPAMAPVEPQRNALGSLLELDERLRERVEFPRLALRVAMTLPPSRVRANNSLHHAPVPAARRSYCCGSLAGGAVSGGGVSSSGGGRT